ncbi:sigma factor-like helix-turn-helix DNA-binding protein [Clostridium algidicarnis]|uniref:sigma factor-like helix-turn-helix DNA-binding protein n=1 Tax=Clostridium algidicarnis TaxID=37659 RepID=UPI003FD7543E
MKREETIKLTDEWIKSVPDIRGRIRLIDISLKNDDYDINTMGKLKQERHELYSKLSKTIKAIGTLSVDNQKIICYRYFDKLKYKEISIRLGLHYNTIPRRIQKLLLDVGRIMFGFEEEFWNAIIDD